MITYHDHNYDKNYEISYPSNIKIRKYEHIQSQL